MVSATQIRKVLAASLFVMALNCGAQSKGSISGSTTRKYSAPPTSSVNPFILQAEEALQKQDYSVAEPLLQKAVVQNSADYRAWFDLGFVYRATNRREDAIAAYRKSVAINP